MLGLILIFRDFNLKIFFQVGDETSCISFDLRPSDAINIAVRCKVLLDPVIDLLIQAKVSVVHDLKESGVDDYV